LRPSEEKSLPRNGQGLQKVERAKTKAVVRPQSEEGEEALSELRLVRTTEKTAEANQKKWKKKVGLKFSH